MFEKILQGLALKYIGKNKEKWVKGAATAAVAYGANYAAAKFGIQLTPEQQLALVATIGGAIVGITNGLKTKFPNGIGKYL